MSAESSADGVLSRIEQLYDHRRTRDDAAQFFVEGVRPLLHAVDHGWTVERLVWSERLLTSSAARKVIRRLTRDGTPATRVSPEQFRRISRGQRASGAGAILRQRIETLHRVAPRQGTCWLVLEQVRSPGNLGTLLRTSAGCGGAGVIVLGGRVDPFDPGAVRASMGALFAQRIVRTGPPQLASWMARHRLQMVGASPDGPATSSAPSSSARRSSPWVTNATV
jgi:RNA methyltransferase, TrmH family